MVALFKTNFDNTQKFIIRKGLVPFVFYFLASQMYSSVIASVQSEDDHFDLGWIEICFYGVPMSLLWVYFTCLEVL